MASEIVFATWVNYGICYKNPVLNNMTHMHVIYSV